METSVLRAAFIEGLQVTRVTSNEGVCRAQTALLAADDALSTICWYTKRGHISYMRPFVDT